MPEPHEAGQCGVDQPVVVVASIDAEHRAAAIGSMLMELPAAQAISYDLDADREVLSRSTAEITRVTDRAEVPLSDPCTCCSLQADLRELLRDRPQRPQVIGLPVTMEPAAVAAGIEATEDRGHVRIVAAVDGARIEEDLFGDDLLDERGIAPTPDDRRALGEVLAHQIESADLIGYARAARGRTDLILDHLLGTEVPRVELHRFRADQLFARAPRRRPSVVDHEHPTLVADQPGFRRHVHDTDGVWTVALHSRRPFAPDRLRAELAALGAGRLRGRGRFWLPTRPHLRCAWDGAGGQLSIGPAGNWTSDRNRHTHLVITGVEDEADRVQAAFGRALATGEELAAGWAHTDDGLDPWLG